MRTTLCLLALLSATSLTAQHLDVIHLDPTYDANLQPTTYKTDKKGRVMACLIVRTPHIRGIRFDDCETEDATDDGTYRLTVRPGLRSLSFEHPNYQDGKVRFKDHDLQIEGGNTYVVELAPSADVYEPSPELEGRRSMYVRFKLHPAEASLEIDGELVPMHEGECVKLLPKGEHRLDVTAPLYYPTHLLHDFRWKKEGEDLAVTLKPNYGWISLEANDVLEGAEFSIGDATRGRYPYRTDRLQSGSYTIMTRQQFYKEHVGQLEVNDLLTTIYMPELEPDFTDVTFQGVDGARITVGGETYGTGRVTRRMQAGDYTIEVQKDRHQPAVMSLHVDDRGDSAFVQLPAPTPIQGSLELTTEDDSCRVTLFDLTDSTYVCRDETPGLFNHLLTGPYQVTVSRTGCLDDVQVISIEADQVTSCHVVLQDYPHEQLAFLTDFYAHLTSGDGPLLATYCSQALGERLMYETTDERIAFHYDCFAGALLRDSDYTRLHVDTILAKGLDRFVVQLSLGALTDTLTVRLGQEASFLSAEDAETDCYAIATTSQATRRRSLEPYRFNELRHRMGTEQAEQSVPARTAKLPTSPADLRWVMGTWRYDICYALPTFLRIDDSCISLLISYNGHERILESVPYTIDVADQRIQLISSIGTLYAYPEQRRLCQYQDKQLLELPDKVKPYDGPADAHPTVTFRNTKKAAD